MHVYFLPEKVEVAFNFEHFDPGLTTALAEDAQPILVIRTIRMMAFLLMGTFNQIKLKNQWVQGGMGSLDLTLNL